MIGKEKFISLIKELQAYNKTIDKIDELIPGFFECHVPNFGWRMFEELMRAYFTLEGVDWIDYYLFENPEKCYHQDEQRVPLETLEDLWDTVATYRKHTDD